MTFAQLAEKANSADNLVIVCGAGVSYGVAPLAKDLEKGLLKAIVYLAEGAEQLSHGLEEKELEEGYFTLELFVSGMRHRVPALEQPLMELYREIFRLKTPNRATEALATALQAFSNAGKQATVLTANFDDGLQTCLQKKAVKYRLITRNNVKQFADRTVQKDSVGQRDRVHVCAYHGTVQIKPADDEVEPSGPTSMTARNLAHPFPPPLSQYVQNTLDNAGLVLFIGHRGEDFYDLNIELRRAVGKAGNDKGRFVCLPHMGKADEVGKSYVNMLGEQGIVIIDDIVSEDWIADLFDAESGNKTPRSDSLEAPLSESGLTNRFLELVDEIYLPSSPQRLIIRKQCAALLGDIRVKALACWSVIEHYRLESIGYSQDEIAAFGRPPDSSMYFGVQIKKLIHLQKEYQAFRNQFQKCEERGTIKPGADIIDQGLKIAQQLEDFANSARRALTQCADGIQKAFARLLAAIPYDYCGLVGMRLMRVIQVPPIPAERTLTSLDGLLHDIDMTTMAKLAHQQEDHRGNGIGLRTELLFRVSAALAKAAGADLKVEAAKFITNNDKRAAYEEDLSQIVGWQDWELAPTENRFRLSFVPVDERLRGYKEMIEKRMKRMDSEGKIASKSDGELSFSAAADAAQCAVRVCEVARLLANVADSGLIRPDPNVLFRHDAQAFLKKIPEQARKCIGVAAETSSVRNHLIMQAYDAILLASLLECLCVLREAEQYAEDGLGWQFDRRLKGMKSRFLLLGSL
jgi:hypothetical protein